MLFCPVSIILRSFSLFIIGVSELLYIVFFNRICEELFWHLDQIPFNGDRRNQRIFYRMKSGWVKPGECFLIDHPMGSDTFDQITAR